MRYKKRKDSITVSILFFYVNARKLIYDKFVLFAGGGALVPITSFGHLLIHGALEKAQDFGLMGLAMGMFDLTSSGIISAIVISFFLSLIFSPKD